MNLHIPFKTLMKVGLISALASSLFTAMLVIGFQAAADQDDTTDNVPRLVPYNGTLSFDGVPMTLTGDDAPWLRFDIFNNEPANGQDPEVPVYSQSMLVDVYAGKFTAMLGPSDDNGVNIIDMVSTADNLALKITILGDHDEDNPALTAGDDITLSNTQRLVFSPFAMWATTATNFNVTANLAVEGSISSEFGDVTVSDNLAVEDGDLILGTNSILNTDSTITSTGDTVTVNDALQVNGDLKFTGSLFNSTETTLTISDDLTIIGNINITGSIASNNTDTLSVNDNLSVVGDILVNGDDIRSGGETLTVDDNLVVVGDITINGDDIRSNGDTLTVDDNLTVTGTFSASNQVYSDVYFVEETGNESAWPNNAWVHTTMTPTSNSFCFLTQVQVTDDDAEDDSTACRISVSGSNWRLNIKSDGADRNSWNSAHSKCEARCFTFK